ncbi:hypothetical protein Taro_011075 [Colocasia esculenta]|uniref:Uncharacterized protein n=1 Tax=Colocasia esculenta TaxID=4460 RepID=A0A843U8W3_COLES|nr:hypothetical protein [Colocasia esculenta]
MSLSEKVTSAASASRACAWSSVTFSSNNEPRLSSSGAVVSSLPLLAGVDRTADSGVFRWVEDERVRPYLRFRGRLRLFSSEDDSLAQVGRVGLLAEGRGGFLSSSAALPFASVAAPICCHRGNDSR